jgi:hypothetical protein
MPNQRTFEVTYTPKPQRRYSSFEEASATKTMKVHLGMRKEYIEAIYPIVLPGHIPQVVLATHSLVYVRSK